jgi:hypothetical protein
VLFRSILLWSESNKKKIFEQNLKNELENLEQDICNNPTDNTTQRLTTVKKELNDIDNEKLRGAQIRAKCLHIDANEYNTKYFLNKEKSKAEAKAMTTLVTNDNEVITDPKLIGQEQRTFYKNLYSEQYDVKKDEVTKSMKYFLESNIKVETIDDIDKDNLDQPVTYDELALALKDLENNKSPGSDGFNANFYKFFWKKIGKAVCASIMYALENNKMSVEQRRAILTLLPKKDKDARFLKNWRPLSLLNTDYKILAKTLAKRLQNVMPELINKDQSGCIKGRSTFTNLRSTIDIINHTNNKNLAGYIAFIDYEKAFDTVKWPFLYQCLQKMNFGNRYIEYIKTLYEDISTHVANCGTLSESFKPGKGIRQGCPISANLFVIIVEIMASAIRQDPKIVGIRIGKKECKISQYADDTCIYVSDVDSLKKVFEILEEFSKCSGLKMNREKCEALGIGATTNFKHKKLRIKWPTEAIKCLGLYISNDTKKIREDNFNKALTKCENILKMWNIQKLTLKGKVLIVNTLVIPQILYPSFIMNAPKHIVNKL